MKILLSLLFLLFTVSLISQNIRISNNTLPADSSAMLHVQSTTKGMLIPRMNTTQRQNINNPAKGLLVFDLSTDHLWQFHNEWIPILTAHHIPEIQMENDSFKLVGPYSESGVPAEGMSLWSKNQQHVYRDTGNVGIAVTDPKESLHMRRDTTPLLIRFDNKRSNSSGSKDTSIVVLASSISNVYGVGTWQNFDVANIQLSDDIHMVSAKENASAIEVIFIPDVIIPTDATVSNIDLIVEAKIKEETTNEWVFRLPLLESVDYPHTDSLTLIYNYIFIQDTTDQKHKPSLLNHYGHLKPRFLNGGLKVSFFSIVSIGPEELSERLMIDKINLKIDYSFPRSSEEQVTWTAGVDNGKFKIANSDAINVKKYFEISETGETRLQSLKISEDAAEGKIFTSNDFGSGSWVYPEDVGIGTGFWKQRNDTVYYNVGPVGIETSHPTALLWDNQQSYLQNSDDLIRTQRQSMNLLLDSDNNDNNDFFAIFNNETVSSASPKLRFHLDNQDSWINSGQFGFQTDVPDTDLHLVHGPSFETDGFKLDHNGAGPFWRFFTNSAGNMLLFNDTSPAAAVGSFYPVNGNYTPLSDARFKSNIQDFGQALSLIKNLEAKRYRFIHQKDDQISIGFLAQDVLKYFPEAVVYHEQEDQYTIDYTELSVLAIQAIQDLDAKVEALDKLVAELTNQLKILENNK